MIEGGCGKYTVHYTLHASDVFVPGRAFVQATKDGRLM